MRHRTTASRSRLARVVALACAAWVIPCLSTAGSGPASLDRPLVVGPLRQASPALVEDGAGGAILLWNEGVSKLFAAHVLPSGDLDAQWPAGGLPVITSSGPWFFMDAKSDGQGGAFVAWLDHRSASAVFVQHVLATGTLDPAWPASGVPVFRDRFLTPHAKLVCNGQGGAIVTVAIAVRGGSEDVFAQHVLPHGQLDPSWPVNGLAVCTADYRQTRPEIASDGAGGAFITWGDLRQGDSGSDVYAHRVLGNGTLDPFWPRDGLLLESALGYQFNPMIVADDADGAMAAWFCIDPRGVGLRHITRSPVLDPSWPSEGLVLGSAPGEPILASLDASVGAGALVCWTEDVGTARMVIVQRVRRSGELAPSWPEGGLRVGTTLDGDGASMATDGAGGAFVAWRGAHHGTRHVFVGHVLASGRVDPAWPMDGLLVSGDGGAPLSPAIVSVGPKGAIVVWQDLRNDAGDLYGAFPGRGFTPPSAGATPVNEAFPESGGEMQTVGDPPVELKLDSPSHSHADATIRYSLPVPAYTEVEVFDVIGHRTRALWAGSQSAGVHLVHWDGLDMQGRPVPSGVYFIRAVLDGRPQSMRVVLIR